MTEKVWDLNIFYKEIFKGDQNGFEYEDVLTINPVVYVVEDNDDRRMIYSDIMFKCTVLETMLIDEHRPRDTYGDDWTEGLEFFLEEVPVKHRLQEFLSNLPDPYSIPDPDAKTIYDVDFADIEDVSRKLAMDLVDMHEGTSINLDTWPKAMQLVEIYYDKNNGEFVKNGV
jgi:hypothetical protein